MTDTDMPAVEQPLEAPIEAVTGMIEASQFHKFKKLMVANELGVTYLAQQRNIAFNVDDEPALGAAQTF
jgi:hypothetical protein